MTNSRRRDTASLGAAGVSLVETAIQLYAPGWKPARPVTDDGIDLRVISPDNAKVYNLQVKTSENWIFNVVRKWENIPNFLGIFVCKLQKIEQAEIYALTYSEMINVLDTWMPARRFVTSRAWTEQGSYGTWKERPKLVEAMRPYLATKSRWQNVLKP